MEKKRNPAAGDTASGAENARVRELDPYRSKSPTTKAEYFWLNVDADDGADVPTFIKELGRLKRQFASLSRAYTAQKLCADAAERAMRDVALEMDRWRKRAQFAEAELRSKGCGS